MAYISTNLVSINFMFSVFGTNSYVTRTAHSYAAKPIDGLAVLLLRLLLLPIIRHTPPSLPCSSKAQPVQPAAAPNPFATTNAIEAGASVTDFATPTLPAIAGNTPSAVARSTAPFNATV